MSELENCVELELPASSMYLALIRSFIGDFPELNQVESTVVEDIKVAVVEAVTNVIKHASERIPQVGFTFSFSVDDCTISIRYMDPEFIPETLPDRDAVPDVHKLAESGYGVFMMRKLMDHVEYLADGAGEVELKMIRSLRPRPQVDST